MMTNFILAGFPAPVPVQLIPGITESQLLNFKSFQTWRDALRDNLALQYSDPDHPFHEDPFSLQRIEIQSVDWFGSRILGFVKLRARIVSKKHRQLPGVAFLRGGSVAIFMVLRPQDSRDERWVVLTEQPRVPAGSLSFVEIPAGILDPSGHFAGMAAMEIEEETGLRLPKSELLNLTELALKQTSTEGSESLQNAMYPSAGGSDEFIAIFLWEKELDRQEIMDLRGKLSGKPYQGETINLRVCDYDELWKVCPRDGKTMAAWALYEGLNRAGIIQEELRKRKWIPGLELEADD